MRDILFRGRSLDSSEFVYGDLVHLGEGVVIVFVGAVGDSHVVDPETVGQFTGLEDSDGNEIYEGDILKWSDVWEGEGPVEDKAVVEWRDGGFMVDSSYIDTWATGLRDTEKVVVVGNIHDNPEVLGI